MALLSCHYSSHKGCRHCEGPHARNRASYEAVNARKPDAHRKAIKRKIRREADMTPPSKQTTVVGYIGPGRMHPVTLARVRKVGHLWFYAREQGAFFKRWGRIDYDPCKMWAPDDELAAVRRRVRERDLGSVNFHRPRPRILYPEFKKRGLVHYWNIKGDSFLAPVTGVRFCAQCHSLSRLHHDGRCDHCRSVERAIAGAKKLVTEADKVRIEIYRHLRDHKPQNAGA